MDTLLPAEFATALPRLRELKVANCSFSAVGGAALPQLSTAFRHLQHLELSVGVDDFKSQLPHLARLPALASLTLRTDQLLTDFLPSLSGKLTALELGAWFRSTAWDRPLQPSPEWKATLQHVAQCTRLQSLVIPCATGPELQPPARALKQLRHLRLNYTRGGQLDGDALLEVLLGPSLTQLTSLTWDDATQHDLQRSYDGRPCSWRRLHLEVAGAQQLARLPLRSVAGPVSCATLRMDNRASAAELAALASPLLRAAGAASLAHVRFPDGSGANEFKHGATPADTPLALLRALRPLLQGPRLHFSGLRWDAPLLRALPPTCRSLRLSGGEMPMMVLLEVLTRLPWLEELYLEERAVEDLSAVVALAATLRARLAAAAGGGAAAPRLRRLHVAGCHLPTVAVELYDAEEDELMFAVEDMHRDMLRALRGQVC